MVLLAFSVVVLYPTVAFFFHGEHYESKKISTYEFYSLLISGFTLLIYAFTLIVIAHQVRMDHERRRKQATIEHIEKTKSVYFEHEQWLVSSCGGLVEPTKLTDDDIKKIKDLLNSIEYLATGVLTGVFDFEMLDRMSGAFFRRLYTRVEPFIKKIRIDRGNPRIYIEFERLADSIDRIRKQGKYSAHSQGVNQATI